MDKTGCSKAQRTVIETLPGPLFVAAGAGSGKTFTLKLRTANAFLPNDSGFQLESIDQVLAITFTKAAAEELLSRIKDTLLKEGLQEQAFAADHAWISTIHGFCSRILRENALEIGLDPELRMITELESEQMQEAARQSVLEQFDAGALSMERVAWSWRLLGSGSRDRGLLDEAVKLTKKLSAMPEGDDAFRHLFVPIRPAALVESLAARAEALLQVTQGWEKINGNTERRSVAALPGAIECAQEWLQSDQGGLDWDDAALDRLRLREVIQMFPALPPTFGRNKEGQDVIDRYRHGHVQAVYESEGALGMEAAEVAFQISKAAHGEFLRMKREAGVVDNEDLLNMTLDALRKHPHLAERYRDQFKLIMIDEFQDTDRVQIEILRLIAQPQLSNVCVVGDAQQSIYRFRGADVNAFTEYRDALVADFPALKEEELQPKLDQNFRSHGDILAFVDCVFSQDDSFGEAYLQLQPKGTVNEEPDAVMDAQPRVSVDIVHCSASDEGLKERALRESAERIAAHFASIKQAYERAGETSRQSFALLLGTTQNAQVYIDALRAVGLESMMTSGSILMGSKEAITTTALLRYALNTQDEQPLLECLTSELFALSDDALLALAYRWSNGRGWRMGLARGFRENDVAPWDLAPEDVEAIRVAREVLDRFVVRARRVRLTEAVRGALVESGYLDRMQRRGVSGLASVGNYSKLLDILKGVEHEQCGLGEAITAFEAKTSYANESPGVLSVSEADFVQIMTIHGSKGLQFDHVAIADVRSGAELVKGLMVENDGKGTFALSKKDLVLESKLKADAAAVLEEERVHRLSDAKTPGELLGLMEGVVKREALSESRRLLYVALTRAVKSLYLSYRTSKAANPKTVESYAGDGVMHEVYTALEWSTAPECSGKVVEYGYGGSRPAPVRFEDLKAGEESTTDDLTPSASKSAPEEFVVPIRVLPKMPPQAPFAGVRANVRSYSSLSHEEAGPTVSLGPIGFEDAEDASVLMREPGEVATAMGTAFHRLAQRAILARERAGGGALRMPPEEAVQAQKEKLDLSEGQCARLDEALAWWFASPLTEELGSYDSLEAEVPFMVSMEGASGPVFLEGEMDALATRGEQAFLVDYKTGGDDRETEEQLYAKHEFQAQCYAYALLRAGFASVKATFVRVEHQQTVTYEFAASNQGALEKEILSHWVS